MQAITSQTNTFQTIHKNRITNELKEIGISRLGLNRFDMRYLPQIVQISEHTMGVAYGYNEGQSVSLVATDQRIIALNKKPLYTFHDDITYDSVSGISFSHAGLGSTITLHTRIKDFTVHTFNRKAAGRFVHFVEFHRLALRKQELMQ